MHIRHIHPVTGWSLSYVAALDAHCPGTAGAFLRASAERRQVVAALLSTRPFPQDPDDAAQLGEFVNTASHTDLLTAAFGFVPRGMRGALARSGCEPHPRSFYRTLYELLSPPENAEIRSVIHRLRSLDLMRLRIVQRLPTDVWSPNLIGVIRGVRMASDVAKLIHLFTLNGINRQALAEALRRVSAESQLSELWDRWSRKLSFPPHPVTASEHYMPTTSGAELRRLALHHRNCARRYLPEILDGESAFAEFRYEGARAVVHLRKEDAGWLLEGLFGKDNGMVSPELRSAAVSHLSERGIRTAQKPVEIAGEWRVLRRLSGRHMFGF